MTLVFRCLIRGYQKFLSPILHALGGPGAGCRFDPSCSEYYLNAIDRHGSIRGTLLGIRRICRCHPWGKSGPDPVPDTLPSSRPKTGHTSTRFYGQKR